MSIPNSILNNQTFFAQLNSSTFTNTSNELEYDGENSAMLSQSLLLLITVVWSLISLIGILANVGVFTVMLCGSKLTPTQYFIINLAISDTLFLTICPTLALINIHGVIIYDHLPSFLAKAICKSDYFSTHVTVFITCLTLMSMTFDRYLVIMYPLKSLSYRSKTKAISINLIIWIVSIVLSLPHGYYRVIETSNDNESSVTSLYCANSNFLQEPMINLYFAKFNLEQVNLLYTIVISYIIPLVSIIICYAIMMNKLRKETPVLNESMRDTSKDVKKRRRVLIMIALVTIMFGLCWAPIHGMHFAMKILKDFPFDNQNLFAFKCLAHTLTYLNSMLNPFMYSIMGNNFRKQAFAQKKRLKTYYTQRNKKQSLTSTNIVPQSARKTKLNTMNSSIDTNVLKSLIKEKNRNGSLFIEK